MIIAPIAIAGVFGDRPVATPCGTAAGSTESFCCFDMVCSYPRLLEANLLLAESRPTWCLTS
jgi:hypothetical protein